MKIYVTYFFLVTLLRVNTNQTINSTEEEDEPVVTLTLELQKDPAYEIIQRTISESEDISTINWNWSTKQYREYEISVITAEIILWSRSCANQLGT